MRMLLCQMSAQPAENSGGGLLTFGRKQRLPTQQKFAAQIGLRTQRRRVTLLGWMGTGGHAGRNPL